MRMAGHRPAAWIPALAIGLAATVWLGGCGQAASGGAAAGTWDGRFATPEKDLPAGQLDLQKLINETKDGGVAMVPLGRYVLAKPLTVARRKQLHISFAPGTQVRIADTDACVILIDGCEKVKVSGCRARHVKPLPEYECNAPVLTVTKSSRVVIENCELNGCGAMGISASDVKNLKVANCHIHHNTFNALGLYNCDEVLVVGNIIEDNANLLQSDNCKDLSWSDNLIRNNGGYWRKARAPGLLPGDKPDSRPWTDGDDSFAN
ncbi:MAG: hypothetical protein BIFFINMI_01761 [Phycisphaerae bacterium]|nr:hypothetical protein [Phycisphaerae bacterium]